MIEVVAAVDVEFESAIVAKLAATPDIEVVRRPADDVELLATAAAGIGSVIVLGRYFTGVDSEVVRRLQGLGARVLGLAADPEVLSSWGIAACVSPWAGSEELAAAVRDCAASTVAAPPPEASPEPNAEAHRGPIIAVWGTGGAPGRSTIAGALAHILGDDGRSVLVDADTVGASQAAMLGLLDDTPQLAALCRAAASGAVGGVLSRHVSLVDERLSVVTGLSRAERWPEIKPAVLAEVLTALSAEYRRVVVDVSDRIDPDDDYADPHYDRHAATRAVLDCADHVVVAAAADPLGLQRLVRLLETPRGLAVRDDCTVVVNKVRATAVGQGAEERIRSTLLRFAGLEQVVLLPDERAVTDAALLAGRTVPESAPRSALALALGELAGNLPGASVPTRPRAGRPKRRWRMWV
ncbi:P-loop NTPase [Brevibacterium daeguense]|uniref:P-loop NTPase n=1 Tax=Brevibacterium daeguense TaxID=909936 RepID=A0ABP8EMF7_9MICO|nr:DNA-binding response regulator [Brevibacterium daeguense]